MTPPGLELNPKLIHTALAVRVARKHACKLALLPRRHGKMVRNGEPSGSPFHFAHFILGGVALRR